MTTHDPRFAGLASPLLPLRSTLEELCAERGSLGAVAPLCVPRKVTDSCDKFLVHDHAGNRLAVVSLSPQNRPRTTDLAAERTREAKAALDERLGRTVLLPWHVGSFDNGIGYSVAPYYRPLSTWRPRRAVERHLLAPRALDWLEQVLRQTARSANAQESQSNFLAPLAALAEQGAVSPEMRERARRELRALEAGDWPARLMLAHYDLWDDNFLFAPGVSDHGFVIIDWGGARAGGHAMYDLVRMALSSPSSDEETMETMREHCRLLECPPEHATGHTLAALGYLAMNLGDWPIERFATTAQRTFEKQNALEQRYRARHRVPVQRVHRHEWGMAATASPLLARLDLADYDALMHANVGTPFKTKPGLAIHQLRDPSTGETLFLKRGTEAPSDPLWRLAARRWLRGRPLHSEPYHVHLAEQTLRAHGFNPMQVLAWGERRAWGWLPTQGFMVARGVPGDSLEALFIKGSASLRQRVLCVVGRLMGRMHQRGFNVTLRLYDLFAPRQAMQAADWRTIDPAIIDLDFKGHLLHATDFDADQAIRTTAHSAYLMLRTGLRFAPGEAAAWLRAYRQQLRNVGVSVPRQLAKSLRRRVLFELRQHHSDPQLVALFPATPKPAKRKSTTSRQPGRPLLGNEPSWFAA